jgi:hypothetical protein
MDRSRSPSIVRAAVAPVSEWSFVKTRPLGKRPASVELRHAEKPIEICLNNVVNPFEPGSFTEPCYRKTLTLRLPTTEWDDTFACMESCVIHEVIQRASTLFEGTYTAEQIDVMYSPITKKVGEYPRDLRTKINTSGTATVRYWDVDKVRVKAPESHANMCWNVRVIIHGLWISKDKWGLVIDATDLIQTQAEIEDCPF